VDGKARLLRDDFCDGLGNCLPVCPTGAISFEEREAAAFDQAGVLAHRAAADAAAASAADVSAAAGESCCLVPETAGAAEDTLPCGCPSSEVQVLASPSVCCDAAAPAEAELAHKTPVSQLTQWPIQIKLVPVGAPFFNNAKLLVAADCCAFANADFHNLYMKGHITLIGCPKLDGEDYSQKLTKILLCHNIKSITVARMEVPCCAGIVGAVQSALVKSGKMIPWNVVTLATNGRVLED